MYTYLLEKRKLNSALIFVYLLAIEFTIDVLDIQDKTQNKEKLSNYKKFTIDLKIN